jgi:hypothetical protein
MFNHISLSGDDRARLLPVRSEAEIEFLVKESEVMTGKPGREFVVTGADRLSYHVEWHGTGLSVRRLRGEEPQTETLFVQRRDLPGHTLGSAMLYGQLFTPQVH